MKGYFILIDGEIVESVGKNGVVKNRLIAEPLYRTLKARNPQKVVRLVEAFKV